MFELATSRKVILSFLALGIVVMVAVSAVQRLADTGLVVQSQMSSTSPEQQKADALSIEIGRHMEELKANPDDFGGLVHISELLMKAEQWEAAQNFLRRAIALDATKAQPHYLLAIILHNDKKHVEAAASLESSIAISDDPSARWSLGVLYVYYLDAVNKGIEQLQLALKSPKLTPELKKNIETELKKVQEALQEAQQSDKKK